MSISASPVANDKLTGSSGGTTSPGVNTIGANFIAVHIAKYDGAGNGTTTPSDNKGNNYALASSPLTEVGSGTNVSSQIYYVENPAVGANHTVTYSVATSFLSMQMVAFSGLATSSVFDVQNGATGLATTLQPGSITPSSGAIDNLILAGLGDDGIWGALAVGSGMAISDSGIFTGGSNEGGAFAYLIKTLSASAINPVWSNLSTHVHSATIASFKGAAAGDVLWAQSIM